MPLTSGPRKHSYEVLQLAQTIERRRLGDVGIANASELDLALQRRALFDGSFQLLISILS